MTQPLLLVDDDADDADIFVFAAKKAGLKRPIRVASSGEEALKLILKEGFSPIAVLLDLKMPGLGGLEVLRRLREAPSTRNLTVFVLTSSPLESDQLESKRLGCSLYFVKPSSLEGYVELASKLAALLPARV
jgi:two-component system response regulator